MDEPVGSVESNTPDAQTADGEVASSDESTSVLDTDITAFQERLTPEDYGYVQKVRDEAAKGRTSLKRFSEAFDGFDDETVDDYLNAVKLIKTDPAQAHQAFSGVAKALAEQLGISEEAAQEIVDDDATTAQDDDPERVLTARDVEELLAKRETDRAAAEEAAKVEAAQVAEQEELRKSIDSVVEELGYKQNTPEHNELFYFATQETEGSPEDKLRAGAAAQQAYRQSVIDQYLADLETQSKAFPPQSDGTSPGNAASEKKIPNIRAGARGAKARLDAVFGESETE